MNKMRSPFRYSKEEKRGVTFLLFLMGLFQVVLWLCNPVKEINRSPFIKVDRLVNAAQVIMDREGKGENEKQFRPFNPNFITDYKGYLLGLSPEELDRLYIFRQEGRYVRTAQEFQRVTRISDSLLLAISPYFSFPDFPDRKRTEQKKVGRSGVVRELNQASAEELQSVSGIGPVLSSRVVRFRDRLGGFLFDEQLFDVYGLDEEVGRRVLEMFRVKQVPEIKTISLNSASEEELSELVYLGKRLARRIVAYRDTHGRFDSIEQLTKIEDFPTDRIDRIRLYLGL